jgi:ubiquinone/menaquinone biosynthesis C-methylase UbiE
MSLDVGCGSTPKGTVNVDFFREGYNPQTGDQKIGEYMKARNIENFIVADALYLPFKDAAFNVVFSSHVIEHVPDAKAMLLEMNRVCKRKIIIHCPHRKGSGAVRPFHVNYLDENWFQNVASNIGLSIKYSFSYEFPIFRGIVKFTPRKFRLKLKGLAKR